MAETLQQCEQELRALEQAIGLVGNCRVDCLGINHFAWDKLYRIGEYLKSRREDIEREMRVYFADPLAVTR